MGTTIKSDIILAIIISAVAVIVGLIANTVRTPILLGMVDKGTIQPATANYYRGVFPVDDWSHGGWPWKVEDEEIEIHKLYYDDVQRIFESGEGVFVDARVLREYKEGHIAGAIPWPFNEFVEYMDKYRDELAYDTSFVVYCEGGNCDQSFSVAESLLVSGYTNISLYLGGHDEWVNMDQPVESGAYDE